MRGNGKWKGGRGGGAAAGGAAAAAAAAAGGFQSRRDLLSRGDAASLARTINLPALRLRADEKIRIGNYTRAGGGYKSRRGGKLTGGCDVFRYGVSAGDRPA